MSAVRRVRIPIARPRRTSRALAGLGRGDFSQVAPHRLTRPVTPCGIGILITCCALLNCTNARAQMSGAFTDAFAPKLQAPRSSPRFQKYDRAALASLAETGDVLCCGLRSGCNWFRFNKYPQDPNERQS